MLEIARVLSALPVIGIGWIAVEQIVVALNAILPRERWPPK